MADRYPLVVDSLTNTVKELPSGDNLNLQGSGVVNAGVITATSLSVSGPITASSVTVSGIDQTPITAGITTIYVATTGNDVTGDGTQTKPFASPHRAMEYLNARQIIADTSDIKVIVSVGIGTYNYGLKITSTGTNYVGVNYPFGENNVFAVTGGSGRGATVGIITATGTAGIVTSVFLIDPGVGYAAGDNLGINTSVGSGLVFQPYAVSSIGRILGPVLLDHPQGDLIYITGSESFTGIRPGRTGNHFYNQAGVGVGSNPAGTGPNFSWSSEYDSTSPAGAYPNPMVDGRGNTLRSASYNASILEAYYPTKLYFHGSDGFVGLGVGNAVVNNMLIVGRTARGFHQTYQWRGAGFRNYSYAVGISSGASSSVIAGSASAIPAFTKAYGGSLNIGNNIGIHGFNDSITLWGGFGYADAVTCTNPSSVCITSINNGSMNLNGAMCLNAFYHGLDSYMGIISFYGGLTNNNGTYGMTINHKAGAFFSPSTGQKTIAANNGSVGLRAQQNSFIRAQASADAPGSSVYVHNNASFGSGVGQIQAITGSYIIRTGAGVSAGAGDATLYNPALNTVAANTTNLID